MTINLQRFFSRFPSFDFDEFRFRELMLSDKQDYFDMMSDPEVVQYLSDEDVPDTLEKAESEIKFWGGLFYRRQTIFWGIAEKETDKFIGTVGFNSWNYLNRRAEISYDFARAYWGRGIGTRLAKRGLVFGFKEMDLYRIEAKTMLENVASQRVLEKLGFVREGVMRGYRFIRGEHTDIVIYGLLKPDFEKMFPDALK